MQSRRGPGLRVLRRLALGLLASLTVALLAPAAAWAAEELAPTTAEAAVPPKLGAHNLRAGASSPTSASVVLYWSNVSPAVTDVDFRFRERGTTTWSDHSFNVADLRGFSFGTFHLKSADFSGLTSDTDYELQARLENAEGEGPWSDSKEFRTATPTVLPPPKPTGFSATQTGSGQVTLRWNEADRATGYEYRLYHSGHCASTADYGEWTSAGSGTSHEVAGLTNNTRYCFQVRATNAGGEGRGSDARAVNVMGLPAAPTGFAAERNSYGRAVRLSWDEADPGWRIEHRFRYKARVGASCTAGGYGDWDDSIGAGQSGYWVYDLDRDTAYCFQLQATNPSEHGGHGGVETVSNAPTDPPSGPPTGRTFVDNRPGQRGLEARRLSATSMWVGARVFPSEIPRVTALGLRYRASGETAWTDHEFRWPASYYPSHRFIPANRQHRTQRPHITITGLAADTAYEVQVRYENALGAGPWSETVEAASTPPNTTLTPKRIRSTTARLLLRSSSYTSIAGFWFKGSQPGARCLLGDWLFSSIDLSGLTPETSYTYKAYTDRGCTSELASVTFRTFAAVPPDAVASVSVTRIGSALSASWEASDRADNYDVEYRDSAATTWTTAATDHTIPRHLTIIGTDAAKAYEVRVKAKNADGESAWTTSPSAPRLPGQIAAPPRVTHNGTSLTVTWTAPDGAAKYDVQYKDVTATTWTTAATDHTTTSLTISGTDATTTYEVRVKPKNSRGEGDDRWTHSAHAAPPTAPDPVDRASIIVVHNGASLTVTWTAPARAEKYDVKYRYAGTGWISAATDHTTTSLTISGTDAAKDYWVQVTAMNDAGASVGTDTGRVPPPQQQVSAPDAVDSASISVTHNGTSLTVTWTAPDGATHYDVTYQGNGVDARAAWNRAGTSLTITCDVRTGYENQNCVSAAHAYTVGIRARNSAGESAWGYSSQPARVSAPDAVGPVSISVTHNGTSLTVTWDAPDGATHYDVTYYAVGAAHARAAWNRAGTSLTITCDVRTGYENQNCVSSDGAYHVGIRARNTRGGESAWVYSRTPASP